MTNGFGTHFLVGICSTKKIICDLIGETLHIYRYFIIFNMLENKFYLVLINK